MSSMSTSKLSWDWVDKHPLKVLVVAAIASAVITGAVIDKTWIGPLARDLENMTKERDGLKSELTSARSEISTAERQLEDARSATRQSSDESSELRRQLEVARAAASEPAARVVAAEKERDEQAAKAEGLSRQLAAAEEKLAAANERLRALEAAAPRTTPSAVAAPSSAQDLSNSPGAVQAGRDVNITNEGAGQSALPNIDRLIALRQKGDELFASAKRLKSEDVPKIAAAVVAWEGDVEPEVAKVSKAALNRFQSARGRRDIGVYLGRNDAYDAVMDRLEFQIEALNSIIDGR